MKPTKTQIVFILVTVYIVAAFGWWTYAHIRSSKLLYQKEIEQVELICYKASLDLSGAISQEIIEDTVGAKNYLDVNYPQLEIVFDETINPLDNYLVRPKLASYESLKKRHTKTIWMYALEGTVMMGLLFWGIIWIYRNLQNKLKLRRQQNNFMLAITHELKTPLASIKLYLETIQKRALTKEQTETMITNSLSDVNRLRDLVDNILLAAQLEGSKYELQQHEISLTDVVQTVVDRFVLPRNLKDRVVLDLERELYIESDENAIEMMLTNLLVNAIKYSPAEGKIKVRLSGKSGHAILSVSDEGMGIPDEEKEAVFTMFYRSGDELTRKTKGTGLGLFIVKSLMNRLGGEIKIKNNLPKGTIFELTFKQHA